MAFEKAKVLIVDDEKVICTLLHRELSERGYACTAVPDGEEALILLARSDYRNNYNVILLDIRLPGISGMYVLQHIQSNYSNIASIMITAVNEVDIAVEAMKWGASDYIVKPFSLERVEASIEISLEVKKWGKRDCEPARCVRRINGNKLATGGFLKEMDAIARGVEIEYDLVMGYSLIVMQRTIQIARQFYIPEKQIQMWVTLRKILDSERNKLVKSAVD